MRSLRHLSLTCFLAPCLVVATLAGDAIVEVTYEKNFDGYEDGVARYKEDDGHAPFKNVTTTPERFTGTESPPENATATSEGFKGTQSPLDNATTTNDRFTSTDCKVDQLQWHVENIRQLISKAEEKGKAEVVSDKLVLAGYSMILEMVVTLEGGFPYVGVYFKLCPGPNDQYLVWPFRTPFTFTVVHPTASVFDIRVTTRTFSSYDFPSFKRPKNGCNASMGSHDILVLTKAEKFSYIVDNAISVTLQLHP